MSIEFQTGKIAASPSLVEQGRRWLDWWVGELRAMVPSSMLARAPSRGNCDLELLLSADGSVSAQTGGGAPVLLSEVELTAVLAALGKPRAGAGANAGIGARGKTQISLDVPAASCLIRRSVLPRQALRDASRILAYEMSENTPLKPDAVYSDWYVESEDPVSHSLNLRHVILARDRIAPIMEALGEAGLALTRLTVGHGDARPLPVDLLSSGTAGFRGFLKSLSVPARFLWVLALMLAVALPLIFQNRADRQLAQLLSERTAVMTAARSSPAIDSQTLESARQLSAIPPLNAILDSLSANQPPEAYFTSLTFDGSHLTVLFGNANTVAMSGAPFFETAAAIQPEEKGVIHLALKRSGGTAGD